MAESSALTILFLAANPVGSSQSRLEQEARDISDGLQRARHRDRFKFEQRWAVRSRDIQLALLECNPQIVHFTGQRQEQEIGQEEGLVFEDDTGHIQLISANALADLFKLFSDRINCVLLNGCYTEIQAKIIAEHIPYVIGMKRSITNKAALDFALGFYDALGAGRAFEFAYHLGYAAIQLAGLPEHLTPILYKKVESDLISTQDAIILDGTTQNKSSKWHIQEKREDLEEEYEDIRKKLKFLKKEWNIKTDSEAKYELTQRIEQYEVQLQNIEELLEELDKK